jgi:hypothetical protein
MGYCLRPGLSFCSIEGQDIFLDVPADRYFSLKSDVAEAFRTLREEGDLPASKLLLLKRFGLIEQVSTTIDLLPDCLDRAVACSIAMDWTTSAIIPSLRLVSPTCHGALCAGRVLRQRSRACAVMKGSKAAGGAGRLLQNAGFKASSKRKSCARRPAAACPVRWLW